MTRLRTRASLATMLTLALGAALVACATPSGPGDAPASGPGAPTSDGTPGPTEPTDAPTDPPVDGLPTDPDWGAAAAYVMGATSIAVMTMGSSSCPPRVDSTSADGQVIHVEFAPETGPCTADYAPRVTLIPVPEGIAVDEDVRIETSGEVDATLRLGGYAGEVIDNPEEVIGAAEAAWLRQSESIVIITWGSSSCPPIVEDVRVESDTEISVVFTVPDPAVACTDDFGPQLTPIPVDGNQLADAGVSVSVSGGYLDEPVELALD